MRNAGTDSEGRRRGGSWEAVAHLARDLRIALRRLGRAPLFGAVVVLTLAVGIGANTAIFSLVKGILLDPLPYPEPERLVSVLASAPGQGQDELRQSAALHLAYEDEAELVERIGLWRQSSVTMLGFDEPMQLSAMLVTDGTLPALRVRPALGRLFRHEDDIPEAPATAVVSHAYWQSQFGGEQDIVRGSMARTAFALAMLSLAAAIALLLATVGVYGVLSHAVMQRTREIGVRIALGAKSSTVIGMVLRQGLLMSTIGVTSGLIAAFWLTRLMSGLLVDVGPMDVATYAVVSACLMAVALAASYLPARRASRVDPIEALRAE